MYLKTNLRKVLPSLAIGICLTISAILFNHFFYQYQVSGQGAGSRPLRREQGDSSWTGRLFGFYQVMAGLINHADRVVSNLIFSRRGSGDASSTRDRVALIMIDETSLMRRGAWPWSRRDSAAILDKVADARVVGFCLRYSEPDPTSLINFIEPFSQLFGMVFDLDSIDPMNLDNDLWLANQISRAKLVLGVILHDNNLAVGTAPDRLIANYSLKAVTPSGRNVPSSKVMLKKSDYIVADLPELRRSNPPPYGEGFINFFPSPSAKTVKVSLFAHSPAGAFASEIDQALVVSPSLAVEMTRIYLGGDGYRLDLRGDTLDISKGHGGGGGGGGVSVGGGGVGEFVLAGGGG
ncbi:MAG: CHASE2 domain-containing protein, partial [Planctomycetes bacterium]|nr:CHASE2 domain-containing protein [Planctomycetota bacterium]